jgi:trans-aconitate methyltransferase
MTMKWNSTLYDKSHDFVSRYGEGLLSYLNPQPGEKILDLGCGTGDLTQKIFQAGAEVTGVDSSTEMIEQAQSKFPEIQFRCMDARELKFNILFDAIFSNAVLHWIPEKEKVITAMHAHLKKDGRLVVEFGGKGNNQQMLKSLRDVFKERGYHQNAAVDFWYYPSIGAYASELEKLNFRVVHAEHFDRVTPLKGDEGMKQWFLMFGAYFFAGISDLEKEDILNEVQRRLMPTHFINGVWNADYKRLRIVALKQ